MSTEELTAVIDDLRGELAEARRYVRTKPDAAMAILDGVVNETLKEIFYYAGMPYDDHARRLLENIIAGEECIRAAPHVLEGYIDGALWELAWMKGQIEKESDPAHLA